MKKEIKSSITILVIVLSVIILTIGVVYLIKNTNSNNSANNKELTNITKLLKNDFLISNVIFGKPSIDEANVVINDIKYDIVVEKELSNISDLQHLIYNTYTDKILETYILDLDKYNKYVEVENNLYVNINSLCTVSNFDKKVKIVKTTGNKIIVKNNNKEISVIKENGKYKLQESAYNCKK